MECGADRLIESTSPPTNRRPRSRLDGNRRPAYSCLVDGDTHGLLIYAALVAIASFIAHLCVRRIWLTCGVDAVGCSVLNLAHEVVTHDFHIRPSDLAYWLPMIFYYGAAVAFPITVLSGLPLHFYRRRKMKR